MIPVTPAMLNEEPVRGRDLRRLAGAVLTQAITDLRGSIPHQQREASEWIFRGDTGAITFDTCCDHLDRDPGRVREKIATEPSGCHETSCRLSLRATHVTTPHAA